MSDLGRGDCNFPSLVEVSAYPFDVESLDAQESVELDVRDQRFVANVIVALARQQDNAGKIAQGIDQGDDLGRQSSA